MTRSGVSRRYRVRWPSAQGVGRGSRVGSSSLSTSSPPAQTGHFASVGVLPAVPRLKAVRRTQCPRTGSHPSHPEKHRDGSSSVCTARDRAFARCGTPSAIALDRAWELEIITVWPDADDPLIHGVPGRYIAARGHAMECQQQALAALDPLVAPGVETFLFNARPAQALISRCRDADLLVVGAGRPGEERARRSVGAECVEEAPCAVTVVPYPHANHAQDPETDEPPRPWRTGLPRAPKAGAARPAPSERPPHPRCPWARPATDIRLCCWVVHGREPRIDKGVRHDAQAEGPRRHPPGGRRRSSVHRLPRPWRDAAHRGPTRHVRHRPGVRCSRLPRDVARRHVRPDGQGTGSAWR